MRRPLQFSLRVFLLVLATMGIIAGLTMRAFVRARAKNAAIDELVADGAYMSSEDGYVADSDGSDPQRVHLTGLNQDDIVRHLERCRRISSVVELELVHVRLSPDILSHVETNYSITSLSLVACKGLQHNTCWWLVQRFPNARAIDLEDSDIDEDGLEVLSRLSVVSKLILTGTPVVAKDVAHVCAMFPFLRHLEIEFADFTGRLDRFCCVPHLETLELNYGSFSEVDLARFLDFTTCTKVEAFGVTDHGEYLSAHKVRSLLHEPMSLEVMQWDPDE